MRADVFESLLDQADRDMRRESLANLTWDGARYALSYELSLYDGQRIWAEERGQRIRGEGKQPVEIIGVITDIQAQKDAEETALHLASFDNETGLWNSARMREGLTQLMAMSERYDHSAALVIFRLKNLADITHNFGFDAGQHLIQAIAARLKDDLRPPDMIARLDATTFAVGLCQMGENDIESAAKRILHRLTTAPYGSPQGDLYADFSGGGSLLITSVDESFTQCRAALNAAEKSNQSFVLYTSEMSRTETSHASGDVTSEDILSILNERRVTLAYQPIINAMTRQVHHYECLLRLVKDDGNLVSAFDIITAAERLDLVHLLDRRALEMAAVTLQQNPDVHLALNISANTVKSAEFANDYLAALKAIGPATQRITLELTETVALEDPAMASRFSDKARALGCQFAIDDFGSGYTSFRNLLAIEADSIKIDGTFIRDLSLTPHKQTFVRMMVDLAQTFSVKTVAEMVGNEEDAELLTRMGVDYLQGFMFGVPSPAPEQTQKAS